MSDDREQAIRKSYEQSEGLDVSCEDIGFLLDALAQLRAERDTAEQVAFAAADAAIAEARAERDTLREALREHGEAWANEAESWRLEILPYFQAQPDEARWDAKELIAAIESRAVVCAENSRVALASVPDEEQA